MRQFSLSKIFATRQHPVKILSYTTKSFWLILIPLARDLFASRYTLSQWLYGSWLSILTIAAIFGFALLRWLTVSCYIGDDCIVAESGFFGISESRIRYSELSCVSSRQGPVLSVFRASAVSLATSGNGRAIHLTLSKKNTERLFSHIHPPASGSARFMLIPKNAQLVLFSLLFSSSLSGVIILLTVLFHAKKIVGDGVQRLLADSIYTISEQTRRLLGGIPPMLSAIAGAVIVLKVISFVTNLFRHINFSITRLDDKLIISSGFITKRTHVLSRESIVFCDIQESLLMKLFSLCSVRIFCSGYGRKNKELSVLVPVCARDRVKSSVRLLLPEVREVRRTILPPKGGFMSYVLLPVLCITGVCIYLWLTRHLSPRLHSISLAPALVVLGVLVWLTVVRVVSLFTSGIGQGFSLFRLDYCRGLRFHTIIVPADKIASVTIRQSPFQKVSGKCTLSFSFSTPSARRHRLFGLYIDGVMSVLRRGFVNSDRI